MNENVSIEIAKLANEIIKKANENSQKDIALLANQIISVLHGANR